MKENNLSVNGSPLDKGVMDKILILHDQYIAEYDEIASRLMEQVPTHDMFFNWLLYTGNDEYQEVLDQLEEAGIYPTIPARSCLIDQEKGHVVFSRD